MTGWMRRTKWHAIAVLSLVLAFALGAATQAQSRQDLARLWLENRLAELLVDLDLTEGQLAELRAVVAALKEAHQARASKAASLLEERKAALLSGEAERVSEIDKELRGLRSNGLSEIPEAKSFLRGLTERQRQVLASLLGEAVTVRDVGPGDVFRGPVPPRALIDRFMHGRGFGIRVILPHVIHRGERAAMIQALPGRALRAGGERLDVLLDLIDEMLG